MIVSFEEAEPVVKSVEDTVAMNDAPMTPLDETVTVPSWAVRVAVPVPAEPRSAALGTVIDNAAAATDGVANTTAAVMAVSEPRRRHFVTHPSCLEAGGK